MDAGARTSLCQIKRRACGGRPMMRPRRARRRVLGAAGDARGGACWERRGGLGDVSSSTRVRSETLVQRCVLVTVPPHVAMCPRSVNQALLLSTRWMFGRVNRMVVIGRFGAFFGRRRLVADADTGWSSAARTAATGCMPHGVVWAAVGLLQSACEAAAWCLLRVSQRRAIRQLFAALSAGTNDRRTVLMLSSLCCS